MAMCDSFFSTLHYWMKSTRATQWAQVEVYYGEETEFLS